ncbi:MAG: hypothetical protein ABJN65_12625 [Parasphingorhabdus sp.]
MITLISENWLFFLIALAIGIATAFWVWAGTGREASEAEQFDADDGLLEKADEVVVPSEREPAPVPAEPTPAAKPAVAATAATVAATKTVEAAPTPAPKPAPRPRKKPVVEETKTPPPPGKPKIAAAVGEPDNLRLIKGVGPKLNGLLNKLGVTRFDQIAAWKAADIAEMDQYLETFSGRITRDSWIDQAKFLAKDDIAGFEKKYGKL